MNKRVFVYIFSLLFIGISNISNAQIFKGMVMGGLNISQIDGDESAGYSKFGFNGGIGVMAALDKTESFHLSLEMLFNQLGAKENLDPFQYNTRLNYVSIPVLFHYEDKKGGWTFGGGFQYSRLISFDEDWGLPEDTIRYFARPEGITIKDFKKEDISVLFDLRFRIWEKLKFNFRYQYTLFSIREPVTYFNGFPQAAYEYKSWQKKFYNNNLSLRLIYVINERPSRELDRNVRRNAY